jgi:hypothetical protein
VNQSVCIDYIGCSFKCILKVGVEESIMNTPLLSLQSKNTNNAKSEVRFKQLIRDLYLIRGAFTIDSSTPTFVISESDEVIELEQESVTTSIV